MITIINSDNKITDVINTKVESLCVNISQQDCLSKNNLKDWISPWDRSLPSPSLSRFGAAATAIGKDIFLFGGVNDEYPNGVFDVEKFNTRHCTWNKEFVIKHQSNY